MKQQLSTRKTNVVCDDSIRNPGTAQQNLKHNEEIGLFIEFLKRSNSKLAQEFEEFKAIRLLEK